MIVDVANLERLYRTASPEYADLRAACGIQPTDACADLDLDQVNCVCVNGLEDGPYGPCRLLSRGLDVMSILGSAQADAILGGAYRILDQTGASAVFATWLQPFIAAGDLSAVIAFSAGPNALSQVTSDTAAAGVMIPLVIEAFKNWHGLPFGAVAFVWVAGSALSWSYAVASSTGAQGIVAGFGANLRRMFVYGMVGAGISVLVTILYYYIAIVVLGADFYILPPSA